MEYPANVPAIFFESVGEQSSGNRTSSGDESNLGRVFSDGSPKQVHIEFVVHIEAEPEPDGWPKKERGSLEIGKGCWNDFDNRVQKIYGRVTGLRSWSLKYIDQQTKDPAGVDFEDEEQLIKLLRDYSKKLQQPGARIECHAWFPTPSYSSSSGLGTHLMNAQCRIHKDVMGGTFIPESKLKAILTRHAIEAFFRDEQHSWPSRYKMDDEKLRTFASEVHTHGKRLLATFITAKISSDKFAIAWKKKQTDKSLPYVGDNQKALYLDTSERQIIDLVQWQTLAIVFERLPSNQLLQQFDRSYRLPIIDKVPVGLGSYGSVSKILIEPSHQRLYRLSNDNNPWLALKEFRRTTRILDWDRESSMLKQIRDLRHPHLMQLLAAFRRGDDCYMILPLANSSLEDVFKTDRDDRQSHQYVLWMMRQLMGLADGLREFHRITPQIEERPQSSLQAVPLNTPRSVYHHDIKPENLVLYSMLEPESGSSSLQRAGMHDWEEPYGRLQITDPGLGKIREPDTLTHTTTLKGTPTYAAPETERERLQGVQADIWAFACVLLEVMVWLTEGPEGYKKFCDVRSSTGHTASATVKSGGYWVKDEDTQKYHVCLTAQLKMNTIRRAVSTAAHGAVSALMNLIDKCWEIDRYARPKAEGVVKELSIVIDLLERVPETVPIFKSRQRIAELLITEDLRRHEYLSTRTWPFDNSRSPSRPSTPAVQSSL